MGGFFLLFGHVIHCCDLRQVREGMEAEPFATRTCFLVILATWIVEKIDTKSSERIGVYGRWLELIDIGCSAVKNDQE